MDQELNTSSPKFIKLSKILILIALLIAILLSYFLVRTFQNKQKTNYTNRVLSLPKFSKFEQYKSTSLTKQENEWEIVTTRPGDTLASIFKRLGLSHQTLQTILQGNPHAKLLSNIKPNQQLQFLIHNQNLEKLIIPVNAKEFLIVEHENNRYTSKINMHKVGSHNRYVTATIHGSLYGTAKRMNIPYKLIQQMTEIFNWEINFARDVQDGDQFTIIYKAFFIENRQIGTGEIVAVTYTTRNKSHQAIRHTLANGDYDYFTPEGANLRKAFTRYPIKFSHISSTFSLSRMHPTLHYRRPHKGVDLAAPLGTPILATGDGRIKVIGQHNGYGNMVKIVHNKTYSSIYGHMLKFQKGLAKGDYIKRGQIIGYVGQTGLATGPHCHYEFHINEQPKNPTTVDLPHALPVPTREMAAFKANAGTLLAHMKLYEEAHLAQVDKKKTSRVG